MYEYYFESTNTFPLIVDLAGIWSTFIYAPNETLRVLLRQSCFWDAYPIVHHLKLVPSW